MRGSNDWIDVSEEEESSDKSIQSVRLRVWELLVDQGPGGLAQPSDPKRHLVNGVLQDLQDPQDKLLQDGDVLGYLLLHSWVALSLGCGVCTP